MNVLLAATLAGESAQGGAAWATLQYALGLRRLGHDVLTVDPVSALTPRGISVLDEAALAFGLEGRIALLEPATRSTHGVSYRELEDAASAADVLLNVSGLLRDERLLERMATRVYLDLDPAFTQLWDADAGTSMGLHAHTHHATVGLSVGAPDSAVSDCGLRWIHTLPPVVLERWPVANGMIRDAFTTVGNWRSYGSIEHDAVRYGQRAHSVRKIIDLPGHTRQDIRPAFAIHPDERLDLEALAAHGWHILDPAEVAATPGSYQAFVQGSKAELGIAKEGYVVSRCGWFSDRSACYLASGRPVVLQETGWSAHLPVGAGLFAYVRVEDAAAAMDAIAGDYDLHRRAARSIAEEYFDSDVVLTRLLDSL